MANCGLVHWLVSNWRGAMDRSRPYPAGLLVGSGNKEGTAQMKDPGYRHGEMTKFMLFAVCMAIVVLAMHTYGEQVRGLLGGF
jgi:hypothetical protein